MPRFRLRSVASGEPVSVDELMNRVRRGDERAFSALYDELAPMVYGIGIKVLRAPALAEELTQEVLVELWQTGSRFDPERGSVRAFVATMTHRRAVDRVRSEEARRRREDRDHERAVPAAPDSVVEDVFDTLDRRMVRRALDSLTETQRDAVMLAFYDGRTYREVAVLLDIPEGTAKTRIRDGLIRLRDTMGVDRS